VREYLNLVDEHGAEKGNVGPCDVFRHLTAQGVESQKAAVLSGLISVMGAMATGSSIPFMAKTDGPNRPAVSIPRNLDPKEVLRVGGKGMLNQVMAIAEALLIPNLSMGLERKMMPPPPPVYQPYEEKRHKEKKHKHKHKEESKKKKPKGLLQMVLQNKDVLGKVLGPILQSIMKNR
jgi:hypothetical protein